MNVDGGRARPANGIDSLLTSHCNYELVVDVFVDAVVDAVVAAADSIAR